MTNQWWCLWLRENSIYIPNRNERIKYYDIFYFHTSKNYCKPYEFAVYNNSNLKRILAQCKDWAIDWAKLEHKSPGQHLFHGGLLGFRETVREQRSLISRLWWFWTLWWSERYELFASWFSVGVLRSLWRLLFVIYITESRQFDEDEWTETPEAF